MIRLFLTLALTVFFVSIFFILFTQTSYIWMINQARRKGVYPRGEVTIEDVKELLRKGERFLAIHAYRSMYRLSFRQAKKEVALLERHMDSKEMA